MNVYSLIAGIIAIMATLGHFTVGAKRYYKPFINTQMDGVVKGTFQCLFHYVSVFMTLSSFMLVMIGIRGSGCFFEPLLILGFIGFNYFLFGIVQLVVTLSSPVKGAPFKMFQWIFWFLISAFTFMALSNAWAYVNEWS
ncbi:hypothetical protein E9993_05060 [Labilibacter sediminis]|nr:hypothetical protein E9993_05060 [Labilibacter sediminis]